MKKFAASVLVLGGILSGELLTLGVMIIFALGLCMEQKADKKSGRPSYNMKEHGHMFV